MSLHVYIIVTNLSFYADRYVGFILFLFLHKETLTHTEIKTDLHMQRLGLVCCCVQFDMFEY